MLGGARGGEKGNREPKIVSAASVFNEQTPSIFSPISSPLSAELSQSEMQMTSFFGVDVTSLRADVIGDVIDLRDEDFFGVIFREKCP